MFSPAAVCLGVPVELLQPDPTPTGGAFLMPNAKRLKRCSSVATIQATSPPVNIDTSLKSA